MTESDTGPDRTSPNINPQTPDTCTYRPTGHAEKRIQRNRYRREREREREGEERA